MNGENQSMHQQSGGKYCMCPMVELILNWKLMRTTNWRYNTAKLPLMSARTWRRGWHSHSFLYKEYFRRQYPCQVEWHRRLYYPAWALWKVNRDEHHIGLWVWQYQEIHWCTECSCRSRKCSTRFNKSTDRSLCPDRLLLYIVFLQKG